MVSFRKRAATTRPGDPTVPGGIAHRGGANFAVEAPHAERLELCLFKPGAATEDVRLPMERDSRGRFHLWVAGVRSGQRYGYRAYGPFAPELGHFFCPSKLLLDPWCRQVEGPLRYHPTHRLFDEAGEPSQEDSAPSGMRSLVVAQPRPLVAKRPRIPLADTVLYEVHVKGMTIAHPQVPEPLRGTFLGLSQRAVVEHLRGLSVTTVSLLPVAASYDEAHLVEKGLTNYWGYAPVCPLAPAPRFATAGGDANKEFRQMVAELHQAGIEVVLDVVFNHTAEGSEVGTSVAYRGLDSRSFYAWAVEPEFHHVDYTGCGNSFDLTHPTCLRHVLDALRHWATEFGIDGYRFDLATTLARTPEGFSPTSPFLSAIMQDPVLRDLKLIAEPWDVGMGGYRLGGFPPGFLEWNDRFRDTLRRFFCGEPGQSADLATRLAGSSDLFGGPCRGPYASVNFVTSHDGFTLADLVTYEQRHNEVNGEENRDGHHANFSQNFGCEGPSADPHIIQARHTAQRAMMLCLACAHGTPMLGHGDELDRSQQGNNNAYCQDGPQTQVTWGAAASHALLPFAQTVFGLRKRHRCLRPVAHMHGADRDGLPDLSWWRADGEQMADDSDWHTHHFAMRVCGERGDGVLLLLNGGSDRVSFVLPPADQGYAWVMVADASCVQVPQGRTMTEAPVAPKSAVVFELKKGA